MNKTKEYRREFCSYQPCVKPTTSLMVLGTVYSQQKSYYRAKRRTRYFIMLFREELVRGIKNWKQKYEITILMMYNNKDLNKENYKYLSLSWE